MTFFTGKGDRGDTTVFGCNQKISKSSTIAEALGSLDEINSFLGLCKVQAGFLGYKIESTNLSDIVHEIQKNLFIVQAELAGADKTITPEKVKELEDIINKIEKTLPPIKSFFISGGPATLSKSEQAGAGLGAIFDIARTIARRAERRVVAAAEEATQPALSDQSAKKFKPLGAETLAYLNRLSSVLYALARYSNHLAGINEEAPDYR